MKYWITTSQNYALDQFRLICNILLHLNQVYSQNSIESEPVNGIFCRVVQLKRSIDFDRTPRDGDEK